MKRDMVVLHMNPERFVQLHKLKDQTKLPTAPALIMHSIQVLLMLYEHKHRGGVIILQDKGGQGKPLKLL